jgi:hypothetical protein
MPQRSLMRPWPWLGEYEYRYNPHAEQDDRGGTVAWEVWHWPTETVMSDWFTATDAGLEVVALQAQTFTTPASERTEG